MLQERSCDANVRFPQRLLVSNSRVHWLRLGGVSDLINLYRGDTLKTKHWTPRGLLVTDCLLAVSQIDPSGYKRD